eukprot:jgi/Chrzof1/5570/Cz16g07270.t1
MKFKFNPLKNAKVKVNGKKRGRLVDLSYQLQAAASQHGAASDAAPSAGTSEYPGLTTAADAFDQQDDGGRPDLDDDRHCSTSDRADTGNARKRGAAMNNIRKQLTESYLDKLSCIERSSAQLVQADQQQLQAQLQMMEICCLSRSSDSVSSALCCGLCLSVGPRWDSGWTVLQIGTSLCLYILTTQWQSTGNCVHLLGILPQIPTTDSYHRFLLPQSD